MRLTTVFLAITLLATAVAGAADVPQSVRATYDVTLNGLHVVDLSEQFRAGNGRYHAESESVPVGLFKLFQPRAARFVSRGRVSEQGLAPEHFEGARGAEDKRRVTADFDWPAGRITLAHDGARETLDLPAGAQDRLSMTFQFMLLDFDGAREIEFVMTNGRKIDRYRYAVNNGVEIDTPLGRIATVHLVRQRDPGDNVTEIWLAPKYRHLVVKMLVIDDGSRYEQMVTGIEIEP